MPCGSGSCGADDAALMAGAAAEDAAPPSAQPNFQPGGVAQASSAPPASTKTYGIPDGCVVRNTFLEWQEGECDGVEVWECPEHRRSCAEARRRVRSCPEEILAAAVESFWEADRGGTELPVAARVPSQPRLPGRARNRGPGYLGDVRCNSNGGGSWSSRNATSAFEAGDGSGGQDRFACNPASNRDRRAGSAADGYCSPWAGADVTYDEDLPRGAHHQRADWPMYGNGGWSPGSPGSKRSRATKYKNATSLVLRGLPFTSTMEEVTAFIDSVGVTKSLRPEEPRIVLLEDAHGRPSGFAEVHLSCSSEFWDCREKLHMQRLGGRYIEVLQPPRQSGGKGERFGGGGFGGSPSSRGGGHGHGYGHGAPQRNYSQWRRPA